MNELGGSYNNSRIDRYEEHFRESNAKSVEQSRETIPKT